MTVGENLDFVLFFVQFRGHGHPYKRSQFLTKNRYDGPRWPKMVQDGAQDGPRWSKMAQDVPKMAKMMLKMAQDGPSPKWLKLRVV